MLIVLLLIPLAFAHVYVYAPDFDPSAYTAPGGLYIDAQEADALVTFLQRAGFDASLVETVPQAERGDVIIVLGCSRVGEADAQTIVAMVKHVGIGLIVDLKCNSPFSSLLDVYPYDVYVGTRKAALSTDYATVQGYYVEAGERTSCAAPACFGYESMYYAGDALDARGDAWRDVFTDASLLVYRNLGEGRVAVTGCLLCASPLLMENMVDWAEDGMIDFPRFQIERSAELQPDGKVHDVFTVVTSRDVSAKIVYTANDTCPLEKVDETPAQPLSGDRASKVFIAILQPTGSVCYTPDALFVFEYNGMQRHVIVRGETVATVTQHVSLPALPSIPAPRSLDDVLMIVAAILFAVFVALVIREVLASREHVDEEKKRIPLVPDKRKIIRKKLRALRLKEREIERTLQYLKRQWMYGGMSEEEFKKTRMLYEAKLANIRARMDILREALRTGTLPPEEEAEEEKDSEEKEG